MSKLPNLKQPSLLEHVDSINTHEVTIQSDSLPTLKKPSLFKYSDATGATYSIQLPPSVIKKRTCYFCHEKYEKPIKICKSCKNKKIQDLKEFFRRLCITERREIIEKLIQEKIL